MKQSLAFVDAPNVRLSQIETAWTMIFTAHDAEPAAQDQAKQDLLAHYRYAIERYLCGAMRDASLAEEAFQEFAVRFLRGDYRIANPEKGRFRNFLKAVLSRLVADHYRRLYRRRETALPDDFAIEDHSDATSHELAFSQVWRDQLLTEAWQLLAEEEKRTNKPWMTVLRLRVEHPTLQSAQLAERIAERIDEPVTANRLRVLLHRSREKFANYLIDVVGRSISSNSLEIIEEELSDLKLLSYCQSIVEQRKRQRS